MVDRVARLLKCRQSVADLSCPEVLLDAWTRFGWEHWPELRPTREQPRPADGGGLFAVLMTEMTAEGVTSLASRGELRRTSAGCWRLCTELVSDRHDDEGRPLHTCSIVASPEPEIQWPA